MIKLLFLVIPLFTVAYGGLKPRIVGGRLAESGELPFQVSLQNIKTKHHFCGGVILNQRYVLTAAHCVTGKDVKNISVNVGTTDLLKPYVYGTYLIASAYVHEQYNRSNSWINDIALLKLEKLFLLSPLVWPIALPKQDQIVTPGSLATVSGFGRLEYEGRRTTRLHVVNITIANHEYCKHKYWVRSSKKIHNTQICAYDPVIEKGSCKGDSGGPLTVNGQLIGLVSWSHRCANKEFPSVYTRVPSYVTWIRKHAV
ncbi:chymotrypsin-2-like [Pogonomyrmex barbatus]|uniref:chymotrypsin n=1 Tax=Pogonomyrmex barbatus TaxID=144034 RepID=A0A6I9VZN1_9HYME|nr:chymotrypsin-2-like [Pogonomyrmex barbatus]